MKNRAGIDAQLNSKKENLKPNTEKTSKRKRLISSLVFQRKP